MVIAKLKFIISVTVGNCSGRCMLVIAKLKFIIYVIVGDKLARI